MKRLHVHVPVDDLDASTRFYHITDPQGLSREMFLTSGEGTVYGDSVDHGRICTTAAACGETWYKPNVPRAAAGCGS